MNRLHTVSNEGREEALSLQFRHSIAVRDKDKKLAGHVSLPRVDSEFITRPSLLCVPLDQQDSAVASVKELSLKMWSLGEYNLVDILKAFESGAYLFTLGQSISQPLRVVRGATMDHQTKLDGFRLCNFLALPRVE